MDECWCIDIRLGGTSKCLSKKVFIKRTDEMLVYISYFTLMNNVVPLKTLRNWKGSQTLGEKVLETGTYFFGFRCNILLVQFAHWAQKKLGVWATDWVSVEEINTLWDSDLEVWKSRPVATLQHRISACLKSTEGAFVWGF